MLTIPKRPLILQLATKGFAVFIIGFVGSMGILNYLHPGKSAPNNSSVVAPGAIDISAKTAAKSSTSAGETNAGTSSTAASTGASTQWQAKLPSPSWSATPYIAPSQTTQPAATSSPSVATSPAAVQPTSSSSTSTTLTSPVPAPISSPTSGTSSGTGGTTSPLLPLVNLQGSTSVTVPVTTNLLP